MAVSYINPWHRPGQVDSRERFTTNAKPTEYRGFLIYQRIPKSYEVVKDGLCVTQRAGLSGAKHAIDEFHDNSKGWVAQRMAGYLAEHAPSAAAGGVR